jgi:HAD superfamily hydrolase (TIGR01509 family)
MTTPCAVIFDLGKVLLDFDYSIAIRRIQKQCSLSLEDLHALINQSPLLYRYETNLLTTAQFFAEVQTASGYCGDLGQFRQVFADIFSPIEPMIELHSQLRGAGVPTFIFSNTNELAIDHIRARFPFFSQFDGYVLSFEHGAMKPDAKIYEAMEEMSGKRGPDLLYIDDRPENIAAGQERGWQAILHQDPVRTRNAVAKTGLLVDCGPAQFPCSNVSRE